MKKSLLFHFILMSVILAGVFLLSIPPQPQYNVIFISIDTLRADHLGVYGYKRDTSPNLDQFAQENILFGQAIAQAPDTLSSHASIFTSQYPAVHGALNLSRNTIDSSKIMLAEILQEFGYKTAAFVGGGQVAAEFGFSQGFDVYNDQLPNAYFAGTIPVAIKWLKENKEDNFFLFLHGYDVHAAYHPPEPFEHIFDPDYRGLLSDHERFRFHISNKTKPNHILDAIKFVENKPVLVLEDKTIPLEQRDIDHIVAHADGDILYTDSLIQQFLDSLKELGVYDNSIIVIFSDHGVRLADVIRTELETELYFKHADELFEEVIHVLLFIKHPDFSARIIPTQVQLIDIFPTVLDFLNIPLSKEVEQQIQGKSLVPLIKGTADEYFNKYVYGQKEPYGVFVRTDRWKLIRIEKSWGLYNRENDPQEMYNVILEYPDIAEKLKQKLQELYLINSDKK